MTVTEPAVVEWPEQAPVLDRLRALLAAAVGDRVELPETGLAELPLAAIGMESWTFVSFLTSVEQEFGIEWDIDTPPDTFRSLGTVAAHLSGCDAAPTLVSPVTDPRPHGGTS
jgi:hypothetical protein